MDALDRPALPCPECRLEGRGGMARIGNRRNKCQACNTFVQAVMRLTRARLLAEYRDEYEEIRMRAELEIYPTVLERFLQKYPSAREGSDVD